MAGTTPNFAFPFPFASDALNGPAAIQSLAAGVDASLKSVKTTADSALAKVTGQLGGLSIQIRHTTIAGGPSWAYTRTYSFDTAFSSPPHVECTLETTAGGTEHILVRPFNITTTGFSCWIYTNDRSIIGDGTSFSFGFVAIGAA